MSKKIGIIGYGVVGKGIHRLIKEDVTAIFDPNINSQTKGFAIQQGKSNLSFNKKSAFSKLDMVVISVPTNESINGKANITLVKKTLSWVSEETKFKGIFLIKSTTPPSEILKLSRKYKKIVFSPEYMGESKYFTPPWKYPDPVNMESHTWQIFGGKKTDTSFCVDIFKGKMGVDTVFIQVDLVTAVLTKYMENSFGAMKVTFCNEWFDIAKNFGVDYNLMRECWLADPRVNRNHTLVFPDNRGYGGKCFPKDTKAIIFDSEKNGYSPKLMKAMDKTNKKFRTMNKKGQ